MAGKFVINFKVNFPAIGLKIFLVGFLEKFAFSKKRGRLRVNKTTSCYAIRGDSLISRIFSCEHVVWNRKLAYFASLAHESN